MGGKRERERERERANKKREPKKKKGEKEKEGIFLGRTKDSDDEHVSRAQVVKLHARLMSLLVPGSDCPAPAGHSSWLL